jgi:phosphoglucomutase
MSMNLHSPQLDLWQTPTWVTYLALYDADGNERTLKEKKHTYASWVKSTGNGAYPDQESEELSRQRINAHLAELKNVTEMDMI